MKYLFIFQHRYTEDYFNNSDIEKLSCVKIKLLKMQIYQKKKKKIIENLILILKIIVTI